MRLVLAAAAVVGLGYSFPWPSLAAGAIASRFGPTSVFWMAVASVGCSATLAYITRVGAEAVEEEMQEAAARCLTL